MKKNFLSLRYGNKVFQMCVCIFILVLTGCATPGGVRLNPTDIKDLNSRVKPPPQYNIGAGDVISVRFPYNPELNNDTIIVSPAGNISMPLVGEIHAEGLALSKLNTLLTEKYYKALGYSLDGNYTLGIGDTLSIKLLYNSELNSDVKVRPDGKISLPLIDEIDVAGKTPSQLKAEIAKQYLQKLKADEPPEVTVIVLNFKTPELNVSLMNSASQIVFVGGEVQQPKVVNISGSMKILNAITMAGGTNNNAGLDSIILIRYSDSDTPNAHLLDMNQVLAGKIPDVVLKPYDIIYVPKDSISQADIFMQHIWRILPTSFVFSFPYNLNPESEVKVVQ